MVWKLHKSIDHDLVSGCAILLLTCLFWDSFCAKKHHTLLHNDVSTTGRHGIRTHTTLYTPTTFPTQPLKLLVIFHE